MTIDGEYPYINFVTNDGRKARILFSEAFSVNSPAVYQNIRVYKSYIDLRNQEGNSPFVACIGKITKDNFEISIVLESSETINIDKKNFYKILREIYRFE